MPNITIANNFTNGATSSADDVMENIYQPKTTPDSLDVINGKIDADNVAAGVTLGRHKFQPFTFGKAFMAGATANLDLWESRWWQGIALTSGDRDSEFLPIPGASVTYYQPYDCTLVLIEWQISWGSDSQATGTNTPIKLFTTTNGSENATRRQAGIAVSGGLRYGKGTDLWYSGHYALTSETAGWKSASLRICSDASQTRVRVRNMRVILFR
jgi:hypothetical protein